MTESVSDALWSMLVSATASFPSSSPYSTTAVLSSRASRSRTPGSSRTASRSPMPIGPTSQSRSARHPGEGPPTIRDAVAEFVAKAGLAPPDAVVDPSALRPV
jgi:hypothetical protein